MTKISALALANGAPSTWPRPDMNAMGTEELNHYKPRRDAIEMYCAGSTLAAITLQTGKSKSEIYRLLKRCLRLASDGDIYGFRALCKNVGINAYTRVCQVTHSSGSGSGGCAGALRQLFDRFPEVEQLVRDLYLKRHHGTLVEARIQLTDIHLQFKKMLRNLGFTDADWPFNTGNCGYKSLNLYLRALLEHEPNRAIASRFGKEASRRNQLGKGIPALLPHLRPYSVVQLDFHKVDAASVIVLTNDNGKEFEVPLARWHFGLMVEEKFGAALGFCVALELTPSADSTLEVVNSALMAHDYEVDNIQALSADHVLINQLMPELSYQCFSILKVDNGWSNAAHEVVNNIISTVGCAINFGPTRAWWRRNLIERIFGELTRRGLQRLPSTYGSGPGDTRCDNPQAQAAKFRISLADLTALFKLCIREHNLSDTEGMQWSSPVRCLQTANANKRSGFFQQPLPRSVQSHMGLMMHMEEVTVRGNVAKGIRPYFKLDRQRHTNEKLAHSYWLIGKTLVAYVDRRLARVVYATIKDTGEQLGRMAISGPWAHSDCTWRERKLMNRAGMAEHYGADDVDPLEKIKQDKLLELKALKASKSKKSSKPALDVHRIEAQQERANLIDPGGDLAPSTVSTNGPPSLDSSFVIGASDPFGLHQIPQLGDFQGDQDAAQR